MKALTTLISLLALTLATGYAVADDATAAKADAQPAAAKEDSAKLASNDKRTRMVCTSERVTGSRFSKRVCMTEEESERMREAGKEAVERVQRMPIPVVSR